jgi:hypothetical protein
MLLPSRVEQGHLTAPTLSRFVGVLWKNFSLQAKGKGMIVKVGNPVYVLQT